VTTAALGSIASALQRCTTRSAASLTASFRTAPCDEAEPSPNRLRWDPLPFPAESADFIDGLITLGSNGDAGAHSGIAIHLYRATRSMQDRVFYDADGELLIVPQQGRLML